MKPMKSVVNMGPFKEKDNWDKPKLTTNLTTISKKATTWEERLSKEYDDGCYRNDTALGDRRLRLWFKSFVASELQQQRREWIEMIEGMKKPLVDYPNGQPKDDWLYGRDRGYNQALNDVLQLLKGEL